MHSLFYITIPTSDGPLRGYNSTTIKQLHSIINICLNVGRCSDRVEAVWLTAENRLPIERLHIYATSLHPEWVTTCEWSEEVNHTGKFLLFCVLSQPVIKPFLTVTWRWRFWLKWRACDEAAEQVTWVFLSPSVSSGLKRKCVFVACWQEMTGSPSVLSH